MTLHNFKRNSFFAFAACELNVIRLYFILAHWQMSLSQVSNYVTKNKFIFSQSIIDYSLKLLFNKINKKICIKKTEVIMNLEYEGWCRRIELGIRAKYPYLKTKIFQVSEYNFFIFVENTYDNFNQISKDFNHTIRFITAPVKLVNVVPSEFIKKIPIISDKDIPSKFEGLPMTIYQLSNHVECLHPGFVVSKVIENHEERKITIEIKGEINEEIKSDIKFTLSNLKGPYTFEITDKGTQKSILAPSNMVFEIASATSQKRLNSPYIDRDEELWFNNVEDIYQNKFRKDDLYFYDSSKTSCLVNFSVFQNSNLRNHLLLYDTVYCVLPLRDNMKSFL